MFNVFSYFGDDKSVFVTVAVATPSELHEKIDDTVVREQLTKLGYSNDTQIVFNPVVLDKGKIRMAAWDSKEMNSIVDTSYSDHVQAHPCFTNTPGEYQLVNAIRRAGSFIVEYHRTHKLLSKSDRGLGGWDRIVNSVRLLETQEVEDTDEFREYTNKVCQLILRIPVPTVYNVKELLDKSSSFVSDVELYSKVLRGGVVSVEEYTSLLPELANILSQAIKEHDDTFDWQTSVLDTTNPTTFSEGMWAEFLINPLFPTPEFQEMYLKEFGYKSINTIFPIPSTGVDKLPKEVADHCIFSTQRSKEWLDQLKFYSCGDNTGIVPCPDMDTYVIHYYHLIRGAALELCVINNTNFTELIGQPVTKATVGLVVAEKGVEKSPGIAPDLLLVTESSQVIPVEIKCMSGSYKDNGDLFRATSLASKQLRQVKSIIPSVSQGGILLMFPTKVDIGYQIRICFSLFDL